MTSGLAWDEVYDLDTPVTRMLFTHPDMGAYVASQDLVHPPGQFLQYSTGSTTLLCSILAPKGGGADFPRRELFAPLGLESAILEPDATGTPVCGSYSGRLHATGRRSASSRSTTESGMASDCSRRAGWRSRSSPCRRRTEIPMATARGGGPIGRARHSAESPLPADAFFAEGHDGQRIIIVPSERLVLVRMGFTAGGKDRAFTLAAEVIAALR